MNSALLCPEAFRSALDVLAEDLQAYFDRMLKGETRGAQLDYGLVGDTKTTLRALTPKLLANDDEEHLAAWNLHLVSSFPSV
jgi:hypothetical protein